MAYQPKQLYAIVLAGRKNRKDLDLLLRILHNSQFDMRDGAIHAAASHNDLEILKKVCELSMQFENADIFSSGEGPLFVCCFRQWLETGVLTPSELLESLRQFAFDAPTKAHADRIFEATMVDRLSFWNAKLESFEGYPRTS